MISLHLYVSMDYIGLSPWNPGKQKFVQAAASPSAVPHRTGEPRVGRTSAARISYLLFPPDSALATQGAGGVRGCP